MLETLLSWCGAASARHILDVSSLNLAVPQGTAFFFRELTWAPRQTEVVTLYAGISIKRYVFWVEIEEKAI